MLRVNLVVETRRDEVLLLHKATTILLQGFEEDLI